MSKRHLSDKCLDCGAAPGEACWDDPHPSYSKHMPTVAAWTEIADKFTATGNVRDFVRAVLKLNNEDYFIRALVLIDRVLN